MPRTIEVELLRELTDTCVPGDTVTVTGIVKREAVDKAVVQKKKNKAVYYIYIEARTLLNTKQPGEWWLVVVCYFYCFTIVLPIVLPLFSTRSSHGRCTRGQQQSR
jgi:hypothetical protein